MAKAKTPIESLIHLIPGEDPQEFRSFARELTAFCRPADSHEEWLVEMLISDGWRLRRYARIQSPDLPTSYCFQPKLAASRGYRGA